MKPLKLRFASQDYDRTGGLTDGSVKIGRIGLDPWVKFSAENRSRFA